MHLISCLLRAKFFSVLLFLLIFLAGCQGGINDGVSSHVSVGTQNNPKAPSKPPSNAQAAAPKPVYAPKPSESRPPASPPQTSGFNNPQQEPLAPPPSAFPSQPAKTQVQVVAANPQQGVPLGDDTQIAVDTIQSDPKPVAPVYTQAPPTTQPAPAPVRVAVDAPLQKSNSYNAPEQAAVQKNKPNETWLERYPNLSNDLQDYQDVIARLENEAKAYRQQLADLQQKVKQQWGVAPAETSAHQLVKYTDSYQSRGAVDFNSGKVIVETVDPSNPKQHLREAIITTLLMPYDADNPEIYTAKKIDYIGPALLAGQVLDHEGQPVQWEWRAERYADYLVANKMQVIKGKGPTIYRVEMPLIENHAQVRGQKYEHLVRASAQRYNIDEVLIYAIMETESNFNPYATSHIPAYGLMQVVPSTAGKDVFTRIKKRTDQPTRDYLFNTTNNIDAGTAYLSILRDNYLDKIRNPLSREYAMISGYNGGAGNVLRTFHADRAQAVNVINQLTPQQVYDRLHLKHPRAEARGYIRKVTEAQQRYRMLASTTAAR